MPVVKVVFKDGSETTYNNARIDIDRRVVVVHHTTSASHTIRGVIPFDAIKVAVYLDSEKNRD